MTEFPDLSQWLDEPLLAEALGLAADDSAARPGASADGPPAGAAGAAGTSDEPEDGRLPDPARLTVWVQGRVQGVGFRWWVRSRALELELTGVAENLSDGRVKVIAEGKPEACLALLGLLEQPGTPGRVVRVTYRWDTARGSTTGFVERLTVIMLVSWANVNLTEDPLRWDHRCVNSATPGAFPRFSRARSLWSLIVEDLKQWRRLCLATLAGLIPAWFLKYAACSGEYMTLRPSSRGCKRSTMF